MTVQDLIIKSLQLIGVVAPGETPSTAELDDAFSAVNLILRNWNAQQIPCYSVQLQTVTLTGAASYPLATRPQRIKSAQVIAANGTAQPPGLVDAVGWTSVHDKTRTGIFAEVLYCDYGYPTATVSMSPRPTGGTLEIYSFQKLTAFASLSTTIDLPDGYERALKYALAIEIAPEYGAQPSEAIVAVAAESKNAIVGLNATVLGEAIPGAAATAQPAAAR